MTGAKGRRGMRGPVDGHSDPTSPLPLAESRRESIGGANSLLGSPAWTLAVLELHRRWSPRVPSPQDGKGICILSCVVSVFGIGVRRQETWPLYQGQQKLPRACGVSPRAKLRFCMRGGEEAEKALGLPAVEQSAQKSL